MSTDNNENNNNSPKNYLTTCILKLQDRYTALSHSQAVRIIGFIAGLFTLIQIVQTSGNGNFSSIFPSLFDISMSQWFELLKFILLFISINILMFYIFRAFFKFSVFSAFVAHMRWVDDAELDAMTKKHTKLVGKNNIVLLEHATTIRICGDPLNGDNDDDRVNNEGQTMYKFIHYDWFISGKNKAKGYYLCFGLSLILTVVLFILLW